MQQALVSVISPCYNVGPYIGRFLDSLISQTYKNLEIILVNDGATDNTGEIIENYIPKLEAEGYKVLYIVQENGGQSSAVNNALKRVTGQFLTWPDPDDWLTPDSIEKRVVFLEKHPDVGMVRCNIEQIEEASGCSLGYFEEDIETDFLIDNAFEKLVFCHTWFGAMACMLRMSCFDEVLKDREIYVTKRGGQNWQMMLPVLKVYPFWQMAEVLGYYNVRNDSHSHSLTSYNKRLCYIDTNEEVLVATLLKINSSVEIIKNVRKKYAQERLYLCLDYDKSFKVKKKSFIKLFKLIDSKMEKMNICRILFLYIMRRKISFYDSLLKLFHRIRSYIN